MNATNRHDQPDANGPDGVLQLRVVVEVDDFDEAIAFYRDQLGMPEEFMIDSGDDARVAALQAGRATLELVTPAQRRLIDELEVGHDVSPRIRVAFEVADVDSATTRLIDAGGVSVAPPTETPWRSRNSRLDGPGPIHLTLFQELDTGAQP
jgi:catechol 2,3-dioxygenase-like lactoylglutathione lyase family enzyme